jgi:competence protein ComEC
LLLPVAGLMIGILLDAKKPVPVQLCTGGFLIAAAATAIAAQGMRSPLLGLCAIPCGALLHDSHFRHLPRQHVALQLDGKTDVVVEGRVDAVNRVAAQEPAARSRAGARRTLLLSVERQVTGSLNKELCGLVQVTLPPFMESPQRGEWLRIRGRCFRFDLPADAGQTRLALARQRRGVHLGLTSRSASDIQGIPAPANWSGLSQKLRSAAASRFRRNLRPQGIGAGLLEAMVLGDRSAVDRDLQRAFDCTGTAHILALSGMNVGILLALVILLTRPLAASARRQAALVLISILAYGVLVEPSPSVHRALGMATVAALAPLLRRPASGFNTLSAVGLLLLVVDPMVLFLPGFQLSFMVTFGLMVNPRLLQSCRPSRWARTATAPTVRPPPVQRVLLEVRQNIAPVVARGTLNATRLAFAVSWTAWFWGLPLVGLHFGQIFPYGAPVSFLTGPLVLGTMATGACHLLAAWFCPWIAPLTACTAQSCAELLGQTIQLLSALPFCTVECPRFSPWLMLIYYSLLILIQLHKTGWRSLAACSVLALCFVMQGQFSERAWAASGADIMILSQRSGAAAVIRLPQGGAFLFDTAGGENGNGAALLSALQSQNIRKLEGIVISQACASRFSALSDVLDKLDVRWIALPAHFERFAAPGTPAEVLLRRLRDDDFLTFELSRGASSSGALPAGTQVLWPPADLPDGAAGADASLVLRITGPAGTCLIVGRLGRYAQTKLLEDCAALSANVLIATVPNSFIDLIPEFVAAVGPKHVVADVGSLAGGITALPRGTTLWNCAQCGAVSISLSGPNMEPVSFRSEPAAAGGNEVLHDP